MEEKTRFLDASGAIFACLMVVALAALNWMFAIYITPVFAKASGTSVPAVYLYALNDGLVPLAMIAAVYSILRVYLSARKGRSEEAAAHRVWAMGLVTASVALLALQIFMALAFVAIWMPGTA